MGRTSPRQWPRSGNHFGCDDFNVSYRKRSWAVQVPATSVPYSPAGMDESTSTRSAPPGEPAPIRWYSRPALDQYLTDARAERAGLQETIADASERLARANSAIGLHQTMMEMLLESQRDVREIRRAAEAESAQVIAEAERVAEQILRRVATQGNGNHSQSGSGVIDPIRCSPAVPPPSNGRSVHLDGRNGGPDDEFFSYLRGALTEDEPLGPSSHG